MAKKWNLVQRHERLPTRPAGCLKTDGLNAGDEIVEELVAPEHKAMATKGIPLAGKITLDQYERLVGLGYDGDVIRRWTQYHAAQELQKRCPGGGTVSAAKIRLRQTVRPPYVRKIVPRGVLPLCPVCRVPVRADRIANHLRRVHHSSSAV